MGLASALVDRGRWLRSQEQEERVEGRPQRSAEVPGPWFRCRLEVDKGIEDRDPAHTTHRKQPVLMCGKRFIDGTLLDVRGDDKIEVVSRDYEGVRVFQIDGDPEVWTKRRVVVGYEFQLVLIEDNRNSVAP
jgi:hypothetical protein